MRIETIVSYSERDLHTRINQLKTDGFEPTVAIGFVDAKLDWKSISEFFAEKQIDFIGASAAGEIHYGEVNEDSCTLMLLDIDPKHYKVAHFDSVEEGGSYKMGLETGGIAKERFKKAHFITCFGMNINGEELIAGIIDTCGKETNIYGGMAANVVDEGQPFVFHDGKKSINGVSFLILDGEKFNVSGFAVNGWEPIGSEHTITKAKYNEIFEIDGQPALEFFKNFFGFYKDPIATDEVSTVNSQYPLQVMRNGEFIMRAPLMSNDEANSLIMAGPIAEGEKFRFSMAPGMEVIDQAVQEFKRFKSVQEKPDALILFSCKARHWTFGPSVEVEIEALNELWEVPLVGFFTFGEIGKNEQKPAGYFNETCCLIAISEV